MKLDFFQFHYYSTFKFVRFVPYYFNKFEKQIVISYFLESVFQLIFHDTTEHRKIIHFPGIYFSGNYFPANKRGLRLEC